MTVRDATGQERRRLHLAAGAYAVLLIGIAILGIIWPSERTSATGTVALLLAWAGIIGAALRGQTWGEVLLLLLSGITVLSGAWVLVRVPLDPLQRAAVLAIVFGCLVATVLLRSGPAQRELARRRGE